jgi:H+-transporting ATPase
MSLVPPNAAPTAVVAATNDSPDGLTSDEARRRLEKSGPNSMPDTSSHPARRAIEKLWAPIPWMLEAAIVLELALDKLVEGGIIAVLLLFNAALGFFQEGRARAILVALKSRLAMIASVRRGGVWKTSRLPTWCRATLLSSLWGRRCCGREIDGGKCSARSIHDHR